MLKRNRLSFHTVTLVGSCIKKRSLFRCAKLRLWNNTLVIRWCRPTTKAVLHVAYKSFTCLFYYQSLLLNIPSLPSFGKCVRVSSQTYQDFYPTNRLNQEIQVNLFLFVSFFTQHCKKSKPDYILKKLTKSGQSSHKSALIQTSGLDGLTWLVTKRVSNSGSRNIMIMIIYLYSANPM